jgi:hypothetical protein
MHRDGSEFVIIRESRTFNSRHDGFRNALIDSRLGSGIC